VLRISHFTNKFDKASGFITKSALTVPVIDDNGNAVGVVQFINKHVSGVDVLVIRVVHGVPTLLWGPSG